MPPTDPTASRSRRLDRPFPPRGDSCARANRRAIEAMRANEGRVDANAIGEMIARPTDDAQVLAYAATHRSARMVTDTETVTATLVMMGISPFFRTFGPQPTIEQRLAEHPEALQGLNDVILRAHRGATFPSRLRGASHGPRRAADPPSRAAASTFRDAAVVPRAGAGLCASATHSAPMRRCARWRSSATCWASRCTR